MSKKHSSSNVQITPFYIADVDNCLITTLLTALFFSKSGTEQMLDSDVDTDTAVHMQEVVKKMFVEPIRLSKSLTRQTVVYVINSLIDAGCTRSNSVKDVFKFISEQLSACKISVQDEFLDTGDTDKEQHVPFINLILPQNSTSNVSVKDMIHKWMNNKDGKITHITNTPSFIVIYIDRYQADKRSNVKVDIHKRISPFHKRLNLNNREWMFQSAVCQSEEHIYTGLLHHNNNNFKFDNRRIPSMTLIHDKDTDTVDKIKTEVVLLIYRLIDT